MKKAFIGIIIFSFIFGIFLEGVWADECPCGPPPPAKPKRIKGGESFPPLPLPATPLRRTERKREPAPPALIGKILGGKVIWLTRGGQRYSYHDWDTYPGDINALLNWTNSKLGIKYRPIRLELSKFSFDPTEIPILYISGQEEFSFGPDEVARIRRYLYDGGFLWADAHCGSTLFVDSFRKEMKEIFLKRPLRKLEPDHPLFNCFYRIESVQYQVQGKGRFQKAPYLEGINLGCRTAVIFSPYDISYGWMGLSHPHGSRILPEGAIKIGANMLTYSLAMYQYGRLWATQKVYYEAALPSRDEFVFGQIIHDGDWDPHPSAIPDLLKFIAANTTVDVQFKRADVDLRKAGLFEYPLLYITGHNDFHFTDKEVLALRGFLAAGGVLLADACCGRQAFDKAFRREIKRVLPEKELAPISPEHPIFSACVLIREVAFTDIVKAQRPGLHTPQVEVVSLGGVASVIYSKYGIGTSWDGLPNPYSKAYAQDDALCLGANVLVYAMTH